MQIFVFGIPPNWIAHASFSFKAEKLLHCKEALQIESDLPGAWYCWRRIVMYLPFCWLRTKQKGSNPRWEPGGRSMLKRKSRVVAASTTRCPLPRSWIDRLLSLPLPRNNPLREKGVKAPQKSREFVPLIGNGNLGCFFIGDAAGFTGFFVCWFWGLFSPGPIPKKQRY